VTSAWLILVDQRAARINHDLLSRSLGRFHGLSSFGRLHRRAAAPHLDDPQQREEVKFLGGRLTLGDRRKEKGAADEPPPV
jgi:hypothetical protein